MKIIPMLVGAALLLGVTGSAAASTTGTIDCGERVVVWQEYLDHFTGDLDLCVQGDIVINAPNGVVADFLSLDAPADFTFTELCCVSNQFYPAPNTPLVAAFIGDATIDWGSFRSDVRLVSSGTITVVPEPSTAALFAVGLLGLGLARRQ